MAVAYTAKIEIDTLVWRVCQWCRVGVLMYI